MKKTIKLLQLIIPFSLLLLFTACPNSAGTFEERTVLFKGNFSIDQSLISSRGSLEEEGARSAQPVLPAITYYAKATNKNNSEEVIDSDDIDESTGTFSIPLKTGKIWEIEVGATGTSAISGTSKVLIKDSITFDPATATSPVAEEIFYLKPQITEDGEGKLNLTIKIENPYGNKIKKVEIKPQKNLTYPNDEAAVTAGWSGISGWDSTSKAWIYTSGLDVTSTKSIAIEKNNFPSGIWEVAVNFLDNGGQLLFASTQIISVYDDLETKSWESSKTTSSSNELIKDGEFKLTTQLVDSYGLTEFYVGGTGASDNNNGGPNKPFATIKKAILIVNGVNRQDQTYTIHVKNGLYENCSSELVVQSNVSIECYLDSYGDRKGSATITSTSSASILKIQRSETSSSALTIEGVKSGNSWTGLKIIKGSSRTTSTSTRGINISTDCSLYMNGGEISGNIISVSANGAGVFVGDNAYFSMTGGIIQNNQAGGRGGGIYISSTGEFSMKGGKIINNQAATAGGAIFDSGAMTVSGPVTISGNTNTASPAEASNVYLTTDKVIKISGELYDSNNVSSIGIKTETSPGVGHPVRFTQGYAFGKEWGQNNDKHPHLIFTSDVAGYSIMIDPEENTDLNTGDAFLGISGGTIVPKAIPQLHLKLERDSANDITGTPGKMAYKISIQEAENLSGTITMHASLKYLGASVPSALWTFTADGMNNSLLINRNLPLGTYTVEVDVKYVTDDFPTGLAYAASLALTIN